MFMTNDSTIELDEVKITWLGHASFRITDGKTTISIDPYVLEENAAQADLILITHDHFDHCDVEKTESIQGDRTRIIAPISCVEKLTGATNSIEAGESFSYSQKGVKISAVEAYNTNKFRAPGEPFHPKGFGVGFVVEIGGKRIYHAGDTDAISEMEKLGSIDVALLPAGGTYTMTMEEAAAAAAMIKPKIAVPMHYNSAKYGVSGIDADPAAMAKRIAGKGVAMRVLKPLV